MELWHEVDRWLEERLVAPDPALEAAAEPAAVAPNQGKLLHLLARMQGARSILELGTLAGHSTIWLARALPEGGRLVTVEADPEWAATARENLERAGVTDRVEVRLGRAAEVLPQLDGPFDLIFLDADKASNPEYLGLALELSRPGTAIVADNVIRAGAMLAGNDPSAAGVRTFLELLAAEPRVSATAIQTVGSKGYDGFALALVIADP